MPPKKGLARKYPSSFGEWIVGTSTEAAFASRAKKQPPKQREIVKVQVTTDDETEEDSIKVTYPRSGRTVIAPLPADAAVKKVRFDVAPKKSALKKAAPVSSESEDDASDSATASKSDESSSQVESSASHAKKQSKPKRSKKMPSDSDGDVDSEPHPTCKCADCVRGREQLKEQAKTDDSSFSATESEASLSEAGSSPRARGSAAARSKAKGAKKNAEESEESQADDEASDSAKGGPGKDGWKRDGASKNKRDPKLKEQKEADDRQKETQKQAEAKKNRTAKAGKPFKPLTARGADQTRDKKQKGKVGSSGIRSMYPEVFSTPHPRRPQLIEPIRAEVVQTERVVERPEDPPPNAYFDPAHGVLRLYHGPVYGSAYDHALYPRAHASGRPLPIGTPHPTQNPYFHGFNQAPPTPHPQAHAPYTQAMPTEHYSASYPLPPFDPGHLSGYPQGGPPPNWQEAGVQANGTRGAFSTTGANVGSPGSRLEDRGGANNVAPGGATAQGYHDNPYYTRRNVSQFSAYGKRGAPDGGQVSGPASGSANGGLASHDGACATGKPSAAGAPESTWNTENTPAAPDQKGGARDADGKEQQQSGQGQEQQNLWGGQADNTNEKTETNQEGGWDNSTKDGGPDNGNPADGASASWGDWGQSENPQPAADSNNVMPGSFPPWGDLTAAASTGGLVDIDTSHSASKSNRKAKR